ncbi:RNA-directed DNA polymerase, eukaryota, reverse transcriptase zinc-binding domain protein [Tanacetum coccineum]|uniref:RNA-directed DNA polymerase, eukaryota, reverse transcriptase zinc-binding domain protein n=1 Tax=Tanacetum coccineum TaxID=301880 RepID=A0ABQ5EYC4_9ASTR
MNTACDQVELRRISLTGFRSCASRSQTRASQSRQSTEKGLLSFTLYLNILFPFFQPLQWLLEFIRNHDGHFVIFGDLNEVRDESERYGTDLCRSAANVFNAFIDDTCLFEPVLGGRNFTCMNKAGTKMNKSDRFLISRHVTDVFTDVKVTALPRGWSDYTSIMLHCEKVDYGPVSFKLFHSWLQRDGFDDCIKMTYNECSTINPHMPFHEKLKVIKQHIKCWTHQVKNVEIARKQEIISKVSDIEVNIDSNTTSKVEKVDQMEFLKERDDLQQLEDMDVAARTMLSASKLALSFWAKAVATACYSQNRSIIISTHGKTAYHIINDMKPSIKHLHIFGCICYITRDGENLDKMKEKGDPCVMVGYSTQSKGYHVYNKRTRLIVESIHIKFDEIKEMMFDHNSLVPQGQKASDYDNSDPVPPRQNVVPTAEKTDSSQQGLEFLFSPLLEEYYNPTHGQAEENNNNQAPNASFQEDEFINPFCTRVQEIGKSSSRNIDNTDVDSFQPQSYDYR